MHASYPQRRTSPNTCSKLPLDLPVHNTNGECAMLHYKQRCIRPLSTHTTAFNVWCIHHFESTALRVCSTIHDQMKFSSTDNRPSLMLYDHTSCAVHAVSCIPLSRSSYKHTVPISSFNFHMWTPRSAPPPPTAWPRPLAPPLAITRQPHDTPHDHTHRPGLWTGSRAPQCSRRACGSSVDARSTPPHPPHAPPPRAPTLTAPARKANPLPLLVPRTPLRRLHCPTTPHNTSRRHTPYMMDAPPAPPISRPLLDARDRFERFGCVSDASLPIPPTPAPPHPTQQ